MKHSLSIERFVLVLGISCAAIWSGCSSGGGSGNDNQNAGPMEQSNDNVDHGLGNDNDGDPVSGNQNGNDNTSNENGSVAEMFSLTVDIVGVGAGSVSLDPPGGLYESGTVVTMTVEADPTFSFAGFSGDADSTESAVAITMDDDHSVTATFVGNLFVSHFVNNTVLEFDGTTGVLVREFIPEGSPADSGGLNGPTDLVFNSEGDLLAASSDSIIQYDGSTGEFLEVLVEPGAGGLATPSGLAVTSDDRLLVATANTILQYHSTTGEFIGDLVSSDGGQLGAAVSLALDSGGAVSVLNLGGDQVENVLQFDGASGQLIGEYIPADGSLTAALEINFSADGDLLAVDSGRVLRFAGADGAFLGEFIEMDDQDYATALVVGPGNDLFVLISTTTIDEQGAETRRQSIGRYDGQTGQRIGVFTEPNDALGFIGYLVFKPLPQ